MASPSPGPSNYAQDLKNQMAIKEQQKAAEKINDRSQDFIHLDTVEHFSPYGKAWRGDKSQPTTYNGVPPTMSASMPMFPHIMNTSLAN